MLPMFLNVANLHAMNRPSEKTRPRRASTALPVLGLLSVGLAVSVALLDRRLEAERDRSASLQSQVSRLAAEKSALLAHLERQAASGAAGSGLGARIPVLPGSESTGRPLQTGNPAAQSLGAAGDGTARGDASGPPYNRAVDRSLALNDPATRDAMRRQQAAAMHRRYPDLADALGLSRESADRFIELQVDRQMRKIDESLQFAAATGERSSAEMKEAGSRFAAAQRDSDEALAAQFGPDVAQRWKTYQQGLGARMELRSLQLELVDAGMALTPAQRDALVAAMVSEQQAGGPAGSKGLTAEARMAQSEASYRRLQDTARTVLSANQFARFDARQRQRLQVMTTANDAERTRSASPP
jgi:hypothetical protein